MKILIAPLNWGLGHAARCIPLVHRYLQEGHEVVLAGDGDALLLLHKQFPVLRQLLLPALRLTYSSGNSQTGAMLRALPKLLLHSIRDHCALQRLLDEESFDLVISDNRFGFFSRKAKCVYITHQLLVPMPFHFTWAEPLVHRLHLCIMYRFDEVWVPDYAGENNLSGDLSHRYPLPPHAHFIGPLSRFTDYQSTIRTTSVYHTVAVLSGLEPQRSLFEQQVIAQCIADGKPALIVRGKPAEPFCRITQGNITLVPWLRDTELVDCLYGAKQIVARSGYSTIMDFDALGVLSKAHLVSTPGQPEQEYLACRYGSYSEYHFV